MSEVTIEEPAEDQAQPTPGLSHLPPLVWIERTGLPAWQIGLTVFLVLVIVGVVSLIAVRYPDPGMYSVVIAFIAIVSFFLVSYLHIGRGWWKDLNKILAFDDELLDVTRILKPSRLVVRLEILLALGCAAVNMSLNDAIQKEYSLIFGVAYGLYVLEWLLVILNVDIFVRQFRSLIRIADNIRIDLLDPDVYSVLANSMLRFLRIYIFGLCVISVSYTVFTAGELGFAQLLILMMPFYLPALVMMGLYLVPYNHFKKRMQVAKSLELNHVLRALKGDRAHLAATLVGEDADKLTRVDLMYYEQRIRNVKEWPFTDRIRGMLLFGVLPPLTWVIAALIEIFIEGAL